MWYVNMIHNSEIDSGSWHSIVSIVAADDLVPLWVSV